LSITSTTRPKTRFSSLFAKEWTQITLLLAPIGIAGAAFMGWLTPFGVGIYVDTLYYVTSARNLLAGIGMGRVTGLGVYKPMTHYPPFYSLVLAFFEACGVSALEAARWISIVAFSASIILVGLIVYQRTRSRVFSLLASLLVISSNVVLRTYSWALSEPLYMLLLLLSVLLLIFYLRTFHRRWLVLAAVSASLTLLTRYVGFSLVGAMCLPLLITRRQSWPRRLSDTAIFLCVTGIPTLVWLSRNWLVSNTLTNRIITWHPISVENLQFLVKALLSWGLIPQRLVVGRETLAFWTIISGLAVVGVIWLIRAWPKPGQSPQPEFILLCSSWLYAGLLGVSLFWVDATTRLENRILLPLYLQIVILIAIGATLLWQQKRLILRLASVGVCLWLVYFSASRLDGAIIDLRTDGQGYASLRWQKSQTTAYLREQETSIIYTNDVTAVYFLAGKDSVAIPNAQASEEDLDIMRSNLTTPHSYLVLFGGLTGEFAPLEQITHSLTLVHQFSDGTIYNHTP
jgi:Dolichyl-phosphate-mannose-protein mannosyltransferase